MSWNSYTDRLVESKVDMCAIHGTNGEPWAQVDSFKCSPQEICAVREVITNMDTNVYGTGAVIGGKRWTVIRLEPEKMVFKGKDTDNQQQTLVVALTAQAVILGTSSNKDVQPAQVRTAVEKMQEYLKGLNY